MSSNNKKIIFWGTPEFAVPSLKSLIKLDLIKAVITQPDRPAGRGKKLTSSPIKQVATEKKIDILDPHKLDGSFLEKLKLYLPATFVVVAYGKLIPQIILDLSQLPAINIHPSKLPKLRGPSPIQTALLKGLESTAVTLIQLDKKMDHGPILGQIQVKIESNDNYYTISQSLAELAGDLLYKKIIEYLDGQLSSSAQDDSQASFCKLIKKEQGKIDWTNSAQDIHNQIRAFYVWPGAYTKLADLEMKIFATKISNQKLNPGQLSSLEERLLVGTNTSALEILDLQPSGKKKITAAEFIRGYQNYLNKNFVF